MRKQPNYLLRKYHVLCFVTVWLLTGCATVKPGKVTQQRLERKTFVITGASSGFGRGVALQLARYHCNIVLAARRIAVLRALAQTIDSLGGKAIAVRTDVSNQEDVYHLGDTAAAVFGSVDVWINDAGVATVGQFWDVPLKEHERVIDVNLKGVFYGSYVALQLFRKQGYGKLINLGSVESALPVAYQSAYSAAKAGVWSLGEVLHEELRRNENKDIKVATIMPWAASTPFWKHLANHSGGTVTMIAMDDPAKVVNAIVRTAGSKRNREVPVGGKARLAIWLHRMLPHFSERITSKIIRKYQYQHPPIKPPSPGNLFEPMPEGRGIRITDP